MVCNKIFKAGRIECLRSHLKTHAGDVQSECVNCQSTPNGTKQSPLKCLQIAEEKQYPCKVCKKEFSSSHFLAVHMKSHISKKCMVTHAGEKSDYCPANNECADLERTHIVDWYRKQNQVKVLQMVSEERLFSCQICVKSFTHKKNLSTHMKIHTGEKQYHCKVCKQVFSSYDLLTVHNLRSHILNECKVCEYSFVTKNELVTHLEGHVISETLPIYQ